MAGGNYYPRKNYKTTKSKKAIVSKDVINPKIKNYVKSAINRGAETKKFRTTIGSVITNTYVQLTQGGAVTCLTNPAQGADNINRIGDQIKAVSLKLKLGFSTYSDNATTISSPIRVIVFTYNKSEQAGSIGSDPTVADILDNGGNVWDYVNSNYNMENKAYKVLYDKVMNWTQDSATSYKSEVKNINIKSSKLPKKTYYVTTGTGTSSRGKGHIYLLVVSTNESSSTVPNDHALIRMYGMCDLHFKDE